MASLVVFSSDIESVDATLSTAQLTDITNYNSQGVLRNTLAVVIFLFKRDANSVDTPITIDNTSPLTATYWTFTLPAQDGVFISLMYGFPVWAPATFTQNQTVYYAGNYYYVNVASTSQTPGGSNWTLIPTANIPTVIAGLSPQPSNLSQTQTYNFSAAHVATGIMANSLSDIGLKIVEGKCRNWQDAAQVLVGASLIDSAWTNFRGSNYTTCQAIIDYLQAQTQLSI